jgi:hypothetical protein
VAFPPTRTKTETKHRAPSCDPPYTVDADGIRIPKPECG